MRQQDKFTWLDEYKQGVISPENLRLLELEALEDDFLFEAMEGIHGAKSVSYDKNLLQDRLAERVQKKVAKRRSMWLPITAVAASVLMWVSVLWWTNSSLEQQNNAVFADVEEVIEDQSGSDQLYADADIQEEKELESIATSTKVQPSPTNNNARKPLATRSTPATTSTVEPEAKAAIEVKEIPVTSDLAIEDKAKPILSKPATKSIEKAESYANHTQKEAIPAASPPPSTREADDAEINFDDIKWDSNEADAVIVAAEPRNEEEIGQMRAGSRAKKRETANMVPEVISGKVIDILGEPLTGATITYNNVRVLSDEYGNFSMPVEELDSKVIVSYTGFQEQEFNLSNNEDINITMLEDASLSEVVITDNQNNMSYPSKGFDVFKVFIADNLVKTKEAIEADISGDVELEFEIDENGDPINFKVLKTPGYGLDQSAINLIKSAGKWTKINSEKIRYTINY